LSFTITQLWNLEYNFMWIRFCLFYKQGSSFRTRSFIWCSRRKLTLSQSDTLSLFFKIVGSDNTSSSGRTK